MKIIILTLLFGLLGYTISKPLETTDATEALVEHRSSDIDLTEDENNLTYYGGLKGHVLQFKDGKFHQINKIEKENQNSVTVTRQGPVAAASSNIAMTSIHSENEHKDSEKSTFAEDFNKIQLAAARLVALQEMAKRKGNFSPEDNRVYAASLLELGQAAQNLAMLQQTGQIHDFSVLLQPMQDTAMPQKTPLGSNNVADAVTVEAQKVDEVTEQHLSESDLLPPNHEDPYEDVNDSVAITPPKKDASVAEAKPIGVSIAGEGGVASSKPNAVALSGRNGLAVSAPKATAIAGVTAEEAAAFSVALPTRNNLIIKSSASRLSSSIYDDYDEIDSSPLLGNTHNIPLLRSAGTMKSKETVHPKPMLATANAAEAIIKMWRTALAQEQALADNEFDAEHYFKNSKQMNQRHKI